MELVILEEKIKSGTENNSLGCFYDFRIHATDLKTGQVVLYVAHGNSSTFTSHIVDGKIVDGKLVKE